jgi:DNA-binding SARP family transcriptional activator
VTGGDAFRLLGPLEVIRHGARVALPAGPQRALLAALLLQPNLPVPAELLLHQIWGERRPDSARASLNMCVMRLRRSLSDPRAALVRTERGGYSIAAASTAVDVYLFRAGLAEAGRAAATGRLEQERALLGEALRLWRGDPLSDIDATVLRDEVCPGLAEERLRAQERYTDLRLLRGERAQLVPELRELVGRHPFREHLWAQLVRALHGSGQRSAALAAYRQVCQLLRDELGVEPGVELRQVEAGVRAGDGAGPDPGHALRAGRAGFPPPPVELVGRATELDAVRALLAPRDPPAGSCPVVCVDGPPGVGKTALILAAAQSAAPLFADGVVYLDLRGHHPELPPLDPAVGLEQLLRGVGVPVAAIPADAEDRAALWRAELSGRRILVMLDDAHCSRQVRPLVPAGRQCALLVAGRRRLLDLEPTGTVSLGVLDRARACELLQRLLGGRPCGAADPDPDDPDPDDPDPADPAAVETVTAAAGHLPLALVLLAERIGCRPGRPLGQLADRLRRGRRALPEFATADRSVGAAFGTSYRLLATGEQALFRLLGRLPDGIDAAAVAGLTGLPPDEVDAGLERLVNAGLLGETATGRYRLHPLVREYAQLR